MKIRRTRRDAVVVELDFWADPAKADPRWIAALARKYPSATTLRREMYRDWTSSAGKPFYPEFTENPERYKRPFRQTLIGGARVARGWDFGQRKPAVVWAQRSPRSGRVWFMRELTYPLTVDLSTHELLDLTLYCSGQRPVIPLEDWEKRRPRGWAILQGLRKLDPPPPWFAEGTMFDDFAGHEATKVSPSVAAEAKERHDAAILSAGGVDIHHPYTSVKAREEVMRGLLLPMADGFPGVLFDPDGCPTLCQGMNGGITYPKATETNPNPTDPRKDKYYEHVHDAAGYLLVNICPVVPGGRQLLHAWGDPLDGPAIVETGGFDIKEMRNPQW